MRYSKRFKEGVEKELDGPGMGGVCPLDDPFTVDCGACPWDMMKTEDSIYFAGCFAPSHSMAHEEQLLAICFVACEAGVL